MIHLFPLLMVLQAAPTPPLPPVAVLKQAKRLNLSAEQVAALKVTQLKYAVELADRRKALVDSAMAFHKEIQAVLTPEQTLKAKKLRIQ